MKVKGLLLASIVLALLVSAVVFTSSSTTAMVVETESAVPTVQADPLLGDTCFCPESSTLHNKFTDCWDCVYTEINCEEACDEPLEDCLACCPTELGCVPADCLDTKEDCISRCCSAGE